MSEPLDVTPVVRQRLAWDICSCDEIDEMWDSLGMVRPSDDVAETAHEESHQRMDKIKPLTKMGDFYIGHASEIISNIMLHYYEKAGGDELTPLQTAIMLGQNFEIIRSTMYPILAALLESGLIEYGPAAYTGERAVKI